jgi:hypothetical protein
MTRKVILLLAIAVLLPIAIEFAALVTGFTIGLIQMRALPKPGPIKIRWVECPRENAPPECKGLREIRTPDATLDPPHS